jgi:hypothetical protein
LGRGEIDNLENNGDSNSTGEDVIPEISRQSDEEKTQLDQISIKNPDPRSYTTRRASLQMAALDRLLFAKRGAALRDEYMRDIRAQDGYS